MPSHSSDPLADATKVLPLQPADGPAGGGAPAPAGGQVPPAGSTPGGTESAVPPGGQAPRGGDSTPVGEHDTQGIEVAPEPLHEADTQPTVPARPVDPAHGDPAHADPAHADPAHADPARADAAYPDPAYLDQQAAPEEPGPLAQAFGYTGQHGAYGEAPQQPYGEAPQRPYGEAPQHPYGGGAPQYDFPTGQGGVPYPTEMPAEARPRTPGRGRPSPRVVAAAGLAFLAVLLSAPALILAWRAAMGDNVATAGVVGGLLAVVGVLLLAVGLFPILLAGPASDAGAGQARGGAAELARPPALLVVVGAVLLVAAAVAAA
jgi:hypothetical protein